MLWPKKNSYKEFDNEKKFLRLENSPPPPITFLMVRPLDATLDNFLMILRHLFVHFALLFGLVKLYFYMKNFCNFIGLKQWYFSLI